jgi:hypothetical protein
MEVDHNAGEIAESETDRDREVSTSRGESLGKHHISGRQGSPTGQDNIAGAHQQTGNGEAPAPGKTVKMNDGGAPGAELSPKNLAD